MIDLVARYGFPGMDHCDRCGAHESTGYTGYSAGPIDRPIGLYPSVMHVSWICLECDHENFRWYRAKAQRIDPPPRIPTAGPGSKDRLMLIHDEWRVWKHCYQCGRAGPFPDDRGLCASCPGERFGPVQQLSDADLAVLPSGTRVLVSLPEEKGPSAYTLGGIRRGTLNRYNDLAVVNYDPDDETVKEHPLRAKRTAIEGLGGNDMYSLRVWLVRKGTNDEN